MFGVKVMSDSGRDFCEWILMSKQKLKERENKQLMIRLNIIKPIIYNVLSKNHNKYKVNNIIPNNFDMICFDIYCKDINEWKGIKTSKEMKKFKDYFKKSKNWWDQHKKCVFGKILCLILNYVENECKNLKCKNQCIYQILLLLLNENVKFA